MSGSDLVLLARALGSLLVVVLVALLIGRFARRGGTLRADGPRVVQRIALSRDAGAVLLEVGGRRLLLGVTAHQVSLLADLDADGPLPLLPELSAAPGPTALPEPPVPSEPSVPPERPALPEQPTAPESDRPEAGSSRTGSSRTGSSRTGSSRTGSSGGAPGEVAPTGSPVGSVRAIPEQPGRDRIIDAEGSPVRRRPNGPAATAAATHLPGPVPATAPATAPAATPLTRRAIREATSHRRRALPPTQRGTGSVLDPRTWQQGLEALRDLTARRG